MGDPVRPSHECLNPGASATTTTTEVLTVSQVVESMTVADKVE